MLSIQNHDKSDKVLIRCSPDLKKAIRVAAAQQDKSIEDLCAGLLSKGLGMPVPVATAPEPKRKRA